MRLTPLPAYRQFVRHGVNDPGAFVSLTADDADASVRRGLRRHFTCEVSAYGAITFRHPRRTNIVRLEPVRRCFPALVTARQAEDLASLLGRSATLQSHRGALYVSAGFTSIAPAAAERLFGRGWLSTLGREGDTVTVSVAGHLAITAHRCKTTGAPMADRLAAYHDTVRAFPA